MMDYDTLMTQVAADARRTLQNALASQDATSGTSPEMLFATTLFCLLEREYRRAPNKKKAILIWEMFLQDNYESQVTNILVPDAGSEARYRVLAFLGLNVEADNGIPRDTFRTVAGNVRVIVCAYQASRERGIWSVFTSRQRRVRALGLGEATHTELFAPVVTHIRGNMTKVVADGDSAKMADGSRKIWGARGTLATIIRSAGFDLNRVGLS
jgi:hypothetical protein